MAIFILSMGLQPMPAQSCDGTSAPPPAHHAGHGEMADMADTDESIADCCASHGVDEPAQCSQAMDCHHCLAGAPIVVLPVQGMIVRPMAMAPDSLEEGVYHRITSPLFRPPKS